MRNQLLKLMDQNNLTYQELAKRTGCSPGVLSKFLYKNETIRFDIIIDLVRELDEEEAIKYMVNYCNEISKPSDIKIALEYLTINLEYEALGLLMDKHKGTENKQLKEFIFLYDIILKFKTGSIDNNQTYEAVKAFKTKSPELIVLIKLIEINLLYNVFSFGQISFFIKSIAKNVEQLDDSFMKKSLYNRYLQYSAHITLHVDKNREKARSEAKKGLSFNLTSTTQSLYYNIMATSYFNDSITKMNHYATISMELLEKTRLNYRIPEIQNRFNKLNLIMGRNDLEIYADKDDPLDLYLEGKKDKNIFKLLESLTRFTKQGNRFLAQVVAEELEILDYDMNFTNLVEEIQSIK